MEFWRTANHSSSLKHKQLLKYTVELCKCTVEISVFVNTTNATTTTTTTTTTTAAAAAARMIMVTTVTAADATT
jgi:hypothetical protein